MFKRLARRIAYRAGYAARRSARNATRNAVKALSPPKQVIRVNSHKEAWDIQYKMSQIALNEARRAKIEAEAALIQAKVDALRKGNPINEDTPDYKALQQIGLSEGQLKDIKGCVKCNFIDISGKERFCPKCGKPVSEFYDSGE